MAAVQPAASRRETRARGRSRSLSPAIISRASIAMRLSCAASALLLFVSSWILIPAPTGLLLPLAVGAPELSPALSARRAVARRHRGLRRERHGVARLALVCSATAACCVLVPVAQLPCTLARFDDAIADTTARPPEPLKPETFTVTRGVPIFKCRRRPPAARCLSAARGKGLTR